MAIIVSTYDSVNKTIEVTVDGITVNDACCVSMYKSENYCDCSVETSVKEENGVKVYTRLCANQKTESAKAFDNANTLFLEKMERKNIDLKNLV